MCVRKNNFGCASAHSRLSLTLGLYVYAIRTKYWFNAKALMVFCRKIQTSEQSTHLSFLSLAL